MERRRLGALEVSALGLGCATMTPFYGEPDPASAIDTIRRAGELCVDLLDTSDAYGNGRNEELISRAVEGRRHDYVIASKFGNLRRPDGTPTADGRPEYVKAACDRSLVRLRTDVIDLYYIHRVDPTVPMFALVGLIIASQLAWPALNLDLPWTSFGRLRPLHTSAVIFAFGGNVLIGTSLYVVQKSCRAYATRTHCARSVASATWASMQNSTQLDTSRLGSKAAPWTSSRTP